MRPQRDDATGLAGTGGVRGQTRSESPDCAEPLADVLQGTDFVRRSSVALDLISRDKRDHARRRPPALTPREALQALQHEVLMVWVFGGNLRAGADLVEEDFQRLTLACNRIQTVLEEAIR